MKMLLEEAFALKRDLPNKGDFIKQAANVPLVAALSALMTRRL